MKKILTTLVLLAATNAFAEHREGQSSVGLQGGQVNLGGEVASQYNNALGWGLYYQYATSPKLWFEMSYLNSKHTGSANGQTLSMTQYDFAGSMLYYFDDFYAFYPYVKGGVDFVLHAPQDVAGTFANRTYDSINGFGLSFAVGGEFEVTTNMFVGLDLTYHNIFDVAAAAPGNPNAKAIQNFTTLMARVGFKFGGEGLVK